jgi:hypothetical protein
MTRDFLSRWSRLKSEADKAAQREPDLDVADPAPPEAPVPDEPGIEASSVAAEPGAELSAEPGAELTAEELAQLPPIEDLVSASDLAPYLRSGVPTLLRNAALRRMWTIDPAIRDYVGDACEYAYDWNVPGGAPGCGPLLPSDDVKAMVRRIFDGPPAAAEDAVEPRETEAPGAAGADGDPLGADSAVTEREEIAASISPAEPTPQSVAVEPLSASTQATVPPRIRRHGGATPA